MRKGGGHGDDPAAGPDPGQFGFADESADHMLGGIGQA
jgi:hypothetical protein